MGFMCNFTTRLTYASSSSSSPHEATRFAYRRVKINTFLVVNVFAAVDDFEISQTDSHSGHPESIAS